MNANDINNSVCNSPQSESDQHNEERSERKVRNAGRKPKSNGPTPTLLTSIDATSAREKKKLDQYARLFEQQDLAQQKKLKKIKPNRQISEDAQPDSKYQRDEKHIDEFEKTPLLAEVDLVTSTKTQMPQEPIMIRQVSNALINAQVLPQLLSSNGVQTEEEEVQQTFTLRINSKLRLKVLIQVHNKKEKHHLFLFLSECQDKCLSGIQKLSSTAPQFYSPPRIHKNDQHSSIFAINQEVLHETQILTNNLISRFRCSGETLTHFGPEQREFVSKFLEKKYLKNTLRESRLQICKRGSEKNNINLQNFNKLIPKKY